MLVTNQCFLNHQSPPYFRQVEYAIEAIKLGSTAIGIQTSEGVVLAVEKRVTSPLMEPTTLEKIVEIDKHIGESAVLALVYFGYMSRKTVSFERINLIVKRIEVLTRVAHVNGWKSAV